jgi:hypothetical protein
LHADATALCEVNTLSWPSRETCFIKSQSPHHVQILAPRVDHLNRHDPAPGVFHPNDHAIKQAQAPGVFHLNHHATEQALAPGIFRLNRRDLAPMVIHLNHHVIEPVFEPDNAFSEL